MDELNYEDIKPQLDRINAILDKNRESGLPAFELISELDVFFLIDALERLHLELQSGENMNAILIKAREELDGQIDSLTKERDELKNGWQEYVSEYHHNNELKLRKLEAKNAELKAKLAKAEDRVKELEGPDYCLRCAGTGSLNFISCFKCNGTGRRKND